jgi:hypothetical protein
MEVDRVIDRILNLGEQINIRVTYANAKRMALKMYGDNSYFSDGHIKNWIEHLKNKRWDFS